MKIANKKTDNGRKLGEFSPGDVVWHHASDNYYIIVHDSEKKVNQQVMIVNLETGASYVFSNDYGPLFPVNGEFHIL